MFVLCHISPRREVAWLARTHIHALEWLDVAGDRVSTDALTSHCHVLQYLSQQIGLTDIHHVNPYCIRVVTSR